jgi:hypothetical protein
MMSKNSVLTAVVMLLVLLATACIPKASSHPPTITPLQPVEEQEGEPTAESSPDQPTSTPAPRVPADIPIMEGAYKVQIMRSATTIVYQVDVSIDTAVKFYQDAFPTVGWETVGPPDTAVGQIATLLRENKQGDRVTINMQGNDVGGFVKITISIARK